MAVSQRKWPEDLLEWGNPVSHQRFGDEGAPIRQHLRLAAKGICNAIPGTHLGLAPLMIIERWGAL